MVLNIPKDNETFDELFANVDLSCRFRVYGPETDLFAGALYETPLYDTKNDPNLEGLLTAHIRKNPSSARIGKCPHAYCINYYQAVSGSYSSFMTLRQSAACTTDAISELSGHLFFTSPERLYGLFACG